MVFFVNIADFNGDGTPEIYTGNEILNAQTGKMLAGGNEGAGYNKFCGPIAYGCLFKHTIAADLLSSPGLELAAGNTVYQVDINNTTNAVGNTMSPILAPAPVKDGFTSIGDINGDGGLDVVVVRDSNYPDGGGIWVWDPRSQTLISSADAGNWGSVPFIGDVDGDCLPEIGMTFQYELRMYKYDGTQQLQLLYSLPTTDQSGITGITMFDFNQDGKQELVYRDETELRILEGETGATIASWPLKSGTVMEYPIVADVDNDGEAEILVNGYQSDVNIDQRIYCFESDGLPWAPARSVWNQYGYHVTNVNDDLTIPRQQQNQATPLEGHEDCHLATCLSPYNAFLSQATYRTQAGCVQFPAVDLSIDIVEQGCAPDSFSVCLSIGNFGSRMLSDSLYISYYLDDPLAVTNAQLSETVGVYFNDTTGSDIVYKDTVCFSGPLPPPGTSLYAVVNDSGDNATPLVFPLNHLVECDYGNNVLAIPLGFTALGLDLGPDVVKCESEVFTFNAGGGFESYLWNDNTTDSIYSSSFDGLHFVEATDGCGRVYRDSVLVSFDHSIDVDLGGDITVCPNDTVSLGLAGAYGSVAWSPNGNVGCDSCATTSIVSDTSFTLMVVAGNGDCLSSDTVEVTVAGLVSVTESLSICEGDNIVFMDSLLTSAGQYEFLLNGCDSVLTLDLSVTGRDTFFWEEDICPGDSVLFAGSWVKEEGVYSVLGQNMAGCDSLSVLALDVTEAITSTDTVRVCEGDSVLVFGQWVLSDTLMGNTYQSSSGCDSTQFFRVEISPLYKDTLSHLVCSGDSVLVGGEWFSEEGTYSLLLASSNDCDTLLNFELVQIPPVVVLDTIPVCEGDSILVGTEWLSGAGNHTIVLGSETVCDSTLYIELVENSPVSSFDTVQICEGDSVIVFGQWVHGDTLLNERYTGPSGCDSTQFFQIITAPLFRDSITYSICNGDSVSVGDEVFTEVGVYPVLLPSQTGCDTLLEVEVVEALPTIVLDTVSTCEGDSIQVGGVWLSGGGSHTVPVVSQMGCDTIFEIQIVEVPPISILDTVTVCEGDSINIFGGWYSGGELVSGLFDSYDGCDSTQSFQVISTPLINGFLTYIICEGDSVLVGSEWLSEGGNYSVVVNSLSGCDTSFQVEINEIAAVENVDTVEVCPGDSVLIFGNYTTVPGEYIEGFTGQNGCDSTQNYVVEMLPFEYGSDTLNFCLGDSIYVADEWVKTAGLYVDTVNSQPCPTIMSTWVEADTVPRTESLVELCPGDSIWIGNGWANGPGEFVQSFPNTEGCDSVHTTVVMGPENPEGPTARMDCETGRVTVSIEVGDLWGILWDNGATTNETTYQQAGTATLTLSSEQPECELGFSISLPPAPDIAPLTEKADTAIEKGQTLAIGLSLDSTEWEVFWSPSEIFSCDTCFSTVISPTENTTVDIFYVHESGCIYRNSFEILLMEEPSIYIPNAFSPNGDGINDTWQVFPPDGVASFDEVRVFSRWGSLVAAWEGIPEVAWDGKFKGEPMNPAVFVYYIRYTDHRGRKREEKGGVNIVK